MYVVREFIKFEYYIILNTTGLDNKRRLFLIPDKFLFIIIPNPYNELDCLVNQSIYIQ